MSRLACLLGMGVELIEHVTSVLATAPTLLFLFSMKIFVLKRVFTTWLNKTSSQIVLLLYDNKIQELLWTDSYIIIFDLFNVV